MICFALDVQLVPRTPAEDLIQMWRFGLKPHFDLSLAPLDANEEDCGVNLMESEMRLMSGILIEELIKKRKFWLEHFDNMDSAVMIVNKWKWRHNSLRRKYLTFLVWALFSYFSYKPWHSHLEWVRLERFFIPWPFFRQIYFPTSGKFCLFPLTKLTLTKCCRKRNF